MHVMIDQPRRLKTGRIKLTMFTPILWHTLVSKQESFQLNLSWYFHNPWTMNGKDMKQSCTKLGSWSIVRFLAWWARLVARNNESSSLWPAGFSKQNHLENWWNLSKSYNFYHKSQTKWYTYAKTYIPRIKSFHLGVIFSTMHRSTHF